MTRGNDFCYDGLTKSTDPFLFRFFFTFSYLTSGDLIHPAWVSDLPRVSANLDGDGTSDINDSKNNVGSVPESISCTPPPPPSTSPTATATTTTTTTTTSLSTSPPSSLEAGSALSSNGGTARNRNSNSNSNNPLGPPPPYPPHQPGFHNSL